MIHIKRSIAAMCVLSASILTVGLFGQGKPPATYLLEGQMLDRDIAISSQCQFRAELWDQKAGYGARIGPVQVYDVDLEQGRFRVQLNQRGEFGANAFQGQGYWLELGVKCSGDSDFVRFEDRQWAGMPADTYDLSWWTIDGGGGTSTGAGGLELTGTIGQPDTGSASGSSGLTLLGGFWGAPGSGYRIYMPMIFRSP
jgi:hypothetical protein